MQLCDAKCCWLKDLDNVPSKELPLWLAYYEIQNKKLERDKQIADAKAKRGR